MAAEELEEKNTCSTDGNPWGILLRVLFAFLQLTWGFPQTLAGAVLFLKYRKNTHKWFQLACHTGWDRKEYGLSLGLFLFTGQDAPDSFIAHEYGHSVQSLLLGPLYLPVIGLPSLIWCLAKPCRRRRLATGKDYYSFYTEAWAEHIADHYRG